MSIDARLREVWEALGCDPNPNDFREDEQAAMWRQALVMIREQYAGTTRVHREAEELRALVAHVPEDFETMFTILGRIEGDLRSEEAHHWADTVAEAKEAIRSLRREVDRYESPAGVRALVVSLLADQAPDDWDENDVGLLADDLIEIARRTFDISQPSVDAISATTTELAERCGR